MEDVWLLNLISAVPTTLKNNVLSGSGMMELQCSAMVLLGSYLFAEYMLMLVPPAVLLKYFQHTWEVHSRMGTVESADEMLGHFSNFEPLNAAMERFQERLHARGQVAYCAQGPPGSPHCLKLPELTATFGGVPVLRPLVDVLIVRCGEDLQWVIEWLKRVLRDEWTPEVLGLQLRLVIYEKCQAPPVTGVILCHEFFRKTVHFVMVHDEHWSLNWFNHSLMTVKTMFDTMVNRMVNRMVNGRMVKTLVDSMVNISMVNSMVNNEIFTVE